VCVCVCVELPRKSCKNKNIMLPMGRDFAALRGRSQPRRRAHCRVSGPRLLTSPSECSCVRVTAGSNDEFAQRCGHDRCPHVAASRTRRTVSRVLLAASFRAVSTDAQVCPVQEPRSRVSPEGECVSVNKHCLPLR